MLSLYFSYHIILSDLKSIAAKIILLRVSYCTQKIIVVVFCQVITVGKMTQTRIEDLNNILSRVYGSVTNNNAFWIRRLDLLTHSFRISYSQSITALSLIYPVHKSLVYAPFSFSIVLLVLFCTPTAASFGIGLPCNSWSWTQRKPLFFCCPRVRVYWTVT
jgi:hypothetical protein